MAKEQSLVTKVCDLVTKNSIYALIFLLPLFFLPWTIDVLDFNKQALLLVLVFVAMFTWIIKSLTHGSFTVNVNKINLIIGALFLVYLASTIFSVSRYGSFWGWPQPAYESLLSMICFCILYFLVSSTFFEKEISDSFTILAVSFFIAEVFGILQLFDFHVLGFDFTKNIYFNTIGAVGTFGLFSVTMLPLCIMLFILAKKWWKALYAVNIVLLFVVLLLINYRFLWWLVLLGSCLIIFFWILKRDLFDGKWMFLPTFFFMMSLFFIMLNPQLNILNQKPVEISLSLQTNFAIDLKALKQKPILGSGPGTFTYDFLKYKGNELNATSFWNSQFTIGFSKLLTSLATTGILGLIVSLALIIYTLLYGIEKFIFDKFQSDSIQISGVPKQKTTHMPLLAAVCTVLIVITTGSFLFNWNLVLDFMYFFFIAVLVALVFKNHTTYILKPSSLLTLIITFAFTTVFIFGIGFLLLEGKRYVAQINYSSALALLAKGNIDSGIQKLEKAASMDDFDLYFRQLSFAYLLKTQNIIKSNQDASDKTKAQLQALIANAINSAKRATDLSPNNVNNWSFRGSVYQNLIGLVTDANGWAITSYDQAILLDPTNPYLLLQKGVIYYQNKEYDTAKVNFEKALSLKSDYADVLYFLGLTYDNQGQKNKAIDTFSRLLALDPQNTMVQKIVANVKAGRPALEGLEQKSVTPPVTPDTPNPSSPSVTSPEP